MNPDKTDVSLILILKPGVAPRRRNRIRARLESLGVTVRWVEGARPYLEVTGDDLPIRTLAPETWDGVDRVVPLAPPYPHVSWGGHRGEIGSPTVVQIGSIPVGAGHFVLMAGPCAVESEERSVRLGRLVADAGAQVFRGGAFKPRTSPYAFQGLGDAGLRILREVRSKTGLPIVTEVMEAADLEKVAEIADLLQVGSRNMQNTALLRRLARLRRPVLLKRGFAATLDELLGAAEYLLSGGNHQVILCERGVRSAAGSDGVILDLGAIPELRRRTHLPVIVDPSHGSRAAHRVRALGRAAVAAGADGLLIEVHDDPEAALSDGRQALTPLAFSELAKDAIAIRSALTSRPRTVPPAIAEPAGKE